MFGMIFTSLSSFTHLCEGIFIKKYQQKHSGGFIFTAMISFFAMLFFIFKDIFTGGFLEAVMPFTYLYAAIAGILYAVASIMTVMAFGCGSFALTNLILSYSIIISIGFGLFYLGEKANVLTCAGLALILVSIFLSRPPRDKDDTKRVTLKWTLLIGLSALGNGGFSVVMRLQQIRFDDAQTDKFMALTLAFSALMLLVAGAFISKRETFKIVKNGALWALGAGVSNATSNMMLLFAQLLLPISIVAPLQSGVKMVLVFLSARLIFREKFLARQIVGVALGSIALVLLNLKI